MIPDYELPEIFTTRINGKRHYTTPEGKHYPSITTVLSCDPEKQKVLDNWRKTFDKRNGEGAAKIYTRKAANRGTSIHTICERYIDCEENHLREAMPDAIAMFKTIQGFIDETEEVWEQEAKMYSDFLETGGRCDLIGRWRGLASIIDFKQSNKPKRREWIASYFMQTAVYAVMFEELTGIPIPQLVIIMAVQDNPPQIFVENRDDWIYKYIELRKYYKELNGV